MQSRKFGAPVDATESRIMRVRMRRSCTTIIDGIRKHALPTRCPSRMCQLRLIASVRKARIVDRTWMRVEMYSADRFRRSSDLVRNSAFCSYSRMIPARDYVELSASSSAKQIEEAQAQTWWVVTEQEALELHLLRSTVLTTVCWEWRLGCLEVNRSSRLRFDCIFVLTYGQHFRFGTFFFVLGGCLVSTTESPPPPAGAPDRPRRGRSEKTFPY